MLQSDLLLCGKLGHLGRQLRGRHGFQQRDRPRPGTLAGAGRHDSVQHLSPAAQIIVRHPARQAQQIRRKQDFIVEYPVEGLECASGGRIAQTHAIADRGLVAPAERRQHAFADGDRLAKILGHGVRIGMIERPVEDDVCKQPRFCRGRRRRCVYLAEQVALRGLGHGRSPEKTGQINRSVHIYSITATDPKGYVGCSVVN